MIGSHASFHWAKGLCNLDSATICPDMYLRFLEKLCDFTQKPARNEVEGSAKAHKLKTANENWAHFRLTHGCYASEQGTCAASH